MDVLVEGLDRFWPVEDCYVHKKSFRTTQGKFAHEAIAAGPVSPVVSTSTSLNAKLVRLFVRSYKHANGNSEADGLPVAVLFFFPKK